MKAVGRRAPIQIINEKKCEKIMTVNSIDKYGLAPFSANKSYIMANKIWSHSQAYHRFMVLSHWNCVRGEYLASLLMATSFRYETKDPGTPGMYHYVSILDQCTGGKCLIKAPKTERRTSCNAWKPEPDY